MTKMILCWLQFHVFAVAEPFQISVCLRCPLSFSFSTSSQAVYKPNDWGHCREQSCVLEAPAFVCGDQVLVFREASAARGLNHHLQLQQPQQLPFVSGCMESELQCRCRTGPSWHAVSTEDTTVHSARLCCLGSPGALGNRGRSTAKKGGHSFGER